MQAYERSLGKDGDLLVVTPDGEFFKYLKELRPSRPRRGAKPRRQPPRAAQPADLLAALGLFLVLEGIAPFLNPAGVKRALARLLEVRRPRVAHSGAGQHAGRCRSSCFCVR